MASYKFVFPIQTGVYTTFDGSFSKYLVVNFFNVDDEKGLIIDENDHHQIFNLSKLNIDWNMLCACYNLGECCVNYIKQFYPGKEVKFITAQTVSKNGTIDDEPSYFLFYGLN